MAEKLTPFVVANRLGRVRFPRSVIVDRKSQIEPDLMVRPLAPLRGWDHAPVPILVVEVLSKTTQKRDLNEKRDFYMEKGVPEYWVVDRYARSVIRIGAGEVETVTSILTWAPKNSAATLDIDVAALFAETVAGSAGEVPVFLCRLGAAPSFLARLGRLIGTTLFEAAIS